ncbi:MAG: MSMEG_1061 family FMN-dependent PPOX-type flavoprotein [Ilumatobacteraceae bacterium]
MSDPHRIGSVEALRTLYREPSQLVVDKVRTSLDEATTAFVDACRFAVLATEGADGLPDASPRGGPSGFIRALDEQRVAIADLGGNNRLDTLQNVVRNGRLGLILVMPGRGETVRINGTAWVTTDPDVLAEFELPKPPKTALVLQVATTFVHCAKAFLRSGMWQPEVWAELADAPDGATILSCQRVADLDADTLRGLLVEGYAAELAEER